MSRLYLDAPNDKGQSRRQALNKVLEQTGVMPPELESEVEPEFWDEPIFNQFFEIFQRGQEFYQTVYYYQIVNELELDGEDLTILRYLWNTANEHLTEKDAKKRSKDNRKSGGKKPPRHRK